MKILVTGSAGFIGSFVADYLLDIGYHKVYCIDDLSGGFLRNINKKSVFTKLDLRDRKKVERYVSRVKPELIYHLAADAAEGRSQFVPQSCTDRNYVAYLNLLVPAIKNGLKKIVVVSSMSVYGAQQTPFSESLYPKPEDIYGINKFSMEKSTEILAKVFGFKFTIIRPHNVYGPRQNLSDPYRNVIAIFINSLLGKKIFYIYGSGKQKRAFTYIADCAPYIAQAGLVDKANGEVINIGPKEYHTINDISKIILKEFFGDSIPQKYQPQYLPFRPQEVIEAYCTCQKAEKILAYKTKTNLREGIRKTIEWARKIGYQKPVYLKDFELVNSTTPLTWRKKLI
ncbi:NAD-dependent epimerase/dehydratase family protein [Candidatus Daviesbacteria bacterium]|nr:NAD-dependent epimerase/dehydratase family protein [Candidatus Daviesbacteria bacterium]